MTAYNDAEEKAIMNYIVQRDEIPRIKGDQLWKEIEEKNIVNRTWQNKYSLSEKTIDEIQVWFYKLPPQGKKYPNLMDQSSPSSSDSDRTP